MDVIDDLTKADLSPAGLEQGTVVTIGAFDGVHRGHQALVGQVVERARARGRLAVLVTFLPHPVAVLAPERAPRYLTTPGEKVALLEGLGLDLVVLLPFNRKVAALPARTFMESLTRSLHVRELWVGQDFALGRNREGDPTRLAELGRELGYELHVFKAVTSELGIISSSRVRALLLEGRVAEVAELLGRFASLSGEVVSGVRRGRTLGFPTANLEVRAERAVPADGVYAVFAVLGEQRYPAVANVGVRPSFDNGHRTIETHIFDFDQDIYGFDLVVEFVARLRDERRFEDIGDLVAQIQRDSEAARRLLESKMPLSNTTRSLPTRHPYRYEEIEHTADLALQVWGRELPGLFTGAARGMVSLMADLRGLMPTEWHELRLSALDRESLLVDWLNELLFMLEMEESLFVECRFERLSDTELTAWVGSVRAPVTKAHIKAATFHNLALVQEDSGWSTVITFDV